MKKILTLALVLALLAPVCIYAAEIEGKVDSYYNVFVGKQVMTTPGDPRVQYENVFVVVTPDNKYYFVPNVPRDVFAKNLGQNVRVLGDLQPQYDSMRAARVQVVKNDKLRTVWDNAQPLLR